MRRGGNALWISIMMPTSAAYDKHFKPPMKSGKKSAKKGKKKKKSQKGAAPSVPAEPISPPVAPPVAPRHRLMFKSSGPASDTAWVASKWSVGEILKVSSYCFKGPERTKAGNKVYSSIHRKTLNKVSKHPGMTLMKAATTARETAKAAVEQWRAQ